MVSLFIVHEYLWLNQATNSFLVTCLYLTPCRSLSFVMVTTGLAFILFAFVYIIVDARRWWSGAPFLFAGNTLYFDKITLLLYELGLTI